MATVAEPVSARDGGMDSRFATPMTPRVVRISPGRAQHLERVRSCFNAFNIIYILGLLGLFSWYLVTMVQNYLANQARPESAVSFEARQSVTFPAITFCHTQSADVAAPNPIDCRLNRGPALPPLPCSADSMNYPRGVADLLVGWNASAMTCTVFNNNTALLLNTSGAGLSYSLDVVLELGVEMTQIVFSPPGDKVTYLELYRSALYLQPSITLLALREIQRRYKSGQVVYDWPVVQSVQYGRNISLELTVDQLSHVSNIDMLLKVRFFYETLTAEVTAQESRFTIAELLGGAAGMLGVLLGLNAVNIMFGLEAVLGRILFARALM